MMDRRSFERHYWENEACRDPDRAVCDPEISVESCLEAILPHLGSPATVLDLGCGTGRLTLPVARLRRSLKVIGLDLSLAMLRVARARAGRLRNVEFFRLDLRDLGDSGLAADAAWSMAVFQHMDEAGVRRVLTGLGQVLRPDGRFRFQFIEGEEREPMSQHFSREAMTAWLEEAGFSVVATDPGLIHPLWTWVTARRL